MADVTSALTGAVKDQTQQLDKQLTEKLNQLQSNPVLKIPQRMADSLRKSGNLEGAVAKLQDRLGKLTSGQKQNLLDSKLAATIFTAGPLDELLTVDTLGISDSGILNTLSGKLSGFVSNPLEAFRTGSGIADELSKMVSSAVSGVKLDPAALASRVIDSLGGNSSMLNGLTSSLTSSLSGGLQFGTGGLPTLSGAAEALVLSAGVDPAIYTQVIGVVGGVAHEFDTNSPQDAQGVFNLISSFTGNSELAQMIDVGAEANVLSATFGELISLGLPEAIPLVIEQAGTAEAAGYALRANLPRALAASDLQTTALVVEKLGIEQVTADVPNAAQRLLHSYKLPKGTPSSAYADRYAELSDLLDVLQPGWGTVKRDGAAISDLELFSTASRDALTLFNTEPSYAVAAIIAPFYPEVNLIQQAKRNYPRTPL